MKNVLLITRRELEAEAGRINGRCRLALAAFLESGCGDTAEAPASAPGLVAPEQDGLAGIPASSGVAIGPLVRLHPVLMPTIGINSA